MQASIIWFLSQARVNWEGYDRKGIWHKNWGHDGGGAPIVRTGWRPDSRLIVCASASVIFHCTIKSRRWRAIMEEVDKGCKEFCVSVGTVTRTDGILIHSLRCLLCVSAVLSVLCHIQFIQQQFVTYCSLWTTQHLVSTWLHQCSIQHCQPMSAPFSSP